MGTHSFKAGDKVKWKWGSHDAHGTVSSVSHRKTTRMIKGEEIIRNGSKADPALYIRNDKQNSGNVLKLASEVRKA